MRAWRGDTGCTLTTRGFKNSLIDPCMDVTYVYKTLRTTQRRRCVALTGNCYLEYNSTTRLSLISGRISWRSGTDLRIPENFLSSTSTQSGKPTWVAIVRAAVMRVCFLAFSRKLITSPALHWYDAMFTNLSFTDTALWLTSWRASARVEAKPMR